MSKMSKKTDIDQKTKKRVWDRDAHCCIICGNPKAMPNAHYIRRSKGGLGIPQNVVTLCQKCHHEMDNGNGMEITKMVKDYLNGWYPEFSDDKRVFDRYDWVRKEENA